MEFLLGSGDVNFRHNNVYKGKFIAYRKLINGVRGREFLPTGIGELLYLKGFCFMVISFIFFEFKLIPCQVSFVYMKFCGSLCNKIFCVAFVILFIEVKIHVGNFYFLIFFQVVKFTYFRNYSFESRLYLFKDFHSFFVAIEIDFFLIFNEISYTLRHF